MPASGNIELLTAVKDGDREAMGVFFNRFSPYVYAVCLRYVPSPEDAEDILHDSFIKIFHSIGSFNVPPDMIDADVCRNIRSWTARVAANVAINYLRDRSRLKLVNISNNELYDIPDDEIDVVGIPIETLMAMIEKLPPNYRAVFNLFAIEGYSHREIAGMIGISESLSATQYHRAKAALKHLILKYQNK